MSFGAFFNKMSAEVQIIAARALEEPVQVKDPEVKLH